MKGADYMALGGPFSFLAGLGLLGAAGAMKIAEEAEVKERWREYGTHKYPPSGFQHDLGIMLINKDTYGGYNLWGIEKRLWTEEEIDGKRADRIIRMTFVKHIVEEIGYEYEDTNLGTDWPGMARNFESLFKEEFRHPHYYRVLECKSRKDFKLLSKKIPYKEEALLDLYNNIMNPYKQIERYQQMGFFKDVKLTPEQLWDPYMRPEPKSMT